MNHPLFPSPEPLVPPPGTPPLLLVVVDTEEEFDWNAPLARENTTVTALPHIQPFQELCDRFAIRPTYVIDHPVARADKEADPLRAFITEHRATIGTHLHPWVSPPHEEIPAPNLSFPGNLPADLERQKLLLLTDLIEERFGQRPRSYKAGRYGFGPHTAHLLEELGYLHDHSSSPGFDFRPSGGPDFSSMDNHPFRFGLHHRLLELPTTGGFLGPLHPWGPSLHALAHTFMGRSLRIPGILSRAGLLTRLRLSPEGLPLTLLQAYARQLVAQAVPILTFSLHSPSLAPGNTPYVCSDNDLHAFLATCRDFFDFFLHELHGRPVTPFEADHILSVQDTITPRSTPP